MISSNHQGYAVRNRLQCVVVADTIMICLMQLARSNMKKREGSLCYS